MQTEELYEVINNMALVVRGLQQDAENAVNIQQELSEQLQQQLLIINETIELALENHVEHLREQVAQQVAQGSQQSMSDFQIQLGDLKKQMMDFSHFAAIVKSDLNKATRSLLMKIGVLAVVALLAIIGSAIWLATYYSQIIQKNKLDAAIAQLYHGADMRTCGKNLCVKIKDNTPSEFKKEGYVLVAPKAN